MFDLFVPLVVTILGAAAVIAVIIMAWRVGAAGVFDATAGFLENVERSLIDILSAFVPYAVPIIPAYLTYYHTKNIMDFPAWVAATAAFVVETLGMASVSTAIKFWRNNTLYKSEQNQAPFKLAATVYAFYIVIVLVVNVVLESIAGTRNGWVIFAIALFSMLSFPSGVLIAIRAQFREILDARHNKSKPQAPAVSASGVRGPVHASDKREKILAFIAKHHADTGYLPGVKVIALKMNLNYDNGKGYISTLRSEWAKENKVEKKNPLTF